MQKLCFFLIILLFPISAKAHEIPKGAAPFEKSESCAPCHSAIYDEWQSSMHAQSSIHKDNAHKAVYKKRSAALSAKGETATYMCATCHMPMPENLSDLMTGNAQPDEAKWQEQEGTGCTFCHRIEEVVPGEQFNHYKLNKDATYGVNNPAEKAPHKTFKSEIMGNGEICMGCHSHLVNPKGASICVMKEERNGNCITCHMPERDGAPTSDVSKETHLDHSLLGGHDNDMLVKAITLEGNVEEKGDKKTVNITITNKISHSFPSTNPMRMAFLKVTAIDSKGTIVWENFKVSPMEDKEALFFKAFKKGDQVGVPSWEAEGTAFDSRLKAKEKRVVSYSLPKGEITTVKLAVIYRLFPPQAIVKMGIPKDGINNASYVVATKELIF